MGDSTQCVDLGRPGALPEIPAFYNWCSNLEHHLEVV